MQNNPNLSHLQLQAAPAGDLSVIAWGYSGSLGVYVYMCIVCVRVCVCVCARACMVSYIIGCGSGWSLDKEVAFSHSPLRKPRSALGVDGGEEDRFLIWFLLPLLVSIDLPLIFTSACTHTYTHMHTHTLFIIQSLLMSHLLFPPDLSDPIWWPSSCHSLLLFPVVSLWSLSFFVLPASPHSPFFTFSPLSGLYAVSLSPQVFSQCSGLQNNPQCDFPLLSFVLALALLPLSTMTVQFQARLSAKPSLSWTTSTNHSGLGNINNTYGYCEMRLYHMRFWISLYPHMT